MTLPYSPAISETFSIFPTSSSINQASVSFLLAFFQLEEVTFVTRGRRLEAIRKQGLRVEGTLAGDFVVRACVCDFNRVACLSS